MVTLQGYTSSSPAISADGGAIYLGVSTATAGRIVAVTPAGRVLWSVTRSDWVDSTPAVGPDGTIYVGSHDGRLYALQPGTGAIRWSYNAGSFISGSPAIGGDGTLYFGSGSFRLHAVGPDGRERWTFPVGDWIESSPAVAVDGTVYVGCRDGALYAVSPEGRERWRFRTGGRIDGSPAIGADGTLYFGSTDQRLYAVAPDGSKRWDYFTNGAIFASPVLGADGAVYFASDDTRFYALDPEDGHLRWRVDLNSSSASTAAVRGDGAIIVAADDGVVRALRPADGGLLWRFDSRAAAGDYIESSVLVAPDGALYFGSLDGRLYKVRGNGSPLSTLSAWPAFRRDAGRTGRAAHVRDGGARLLNLASRAEVASAGVLIAGFVVEGRAPRAYLVRGAGPALAAFGVTGFLPDPFLTVYSGATPLRANDNWGQTGPGPSVIDTADAVGAFPFAAESRDAALVLGLGAGLYTAHLRDAEDRGGVALFEVYDALGGDPDNRLVNLSLRGRVGQGESLLIPGFVLGGGAPARVLVRAAGPALATFGVAEPLPRPQIAIYQGDRLLRLNRGWSEGGIAHDLRVAAESVGAFPWPDGSADAALLLLLDPGPYTLQVSGWDGSGGEALAEVYLLR
ncbi:MAG: PQQ-binding-like beta-propeller repeat protein [Opitutaceae bacterium]